MCNFCARYFKALISLVNVCLYFVSLLSICLLAPLFGYSFERGIFHLKANFQYSAINKINECSFFTKLIVNGIINE